MMEFRLAALGRIPGLVGRYSPLSAAEVLSTVEVARQKIRGATDAGTIPPVTYSASLYQLRTDEVRRLLRGLPVTEQSVEVIWPQEGTGVEMTFADFIEHYDDLWFPSRDDVVVVGIRRAWVLQLDHEENLLFSGSGAVCGLTPS